MLIIEYNLIRLTNTRSIMIKQLSELYVIYTLPGDLTSMILSSEWNGINSWNRCYWVL